tara:strand:+ start:187 stop:516 length:330 start_codon:yes stop_codon:yes gene_type:complete
VSPVTMESKVFKDMDDVYVELEACYDEIMEKGISQIGDTLYTEHFFFCNTEDIVDQDCQNTIKKYLFCKAFSVPPYKSLDETPATIIDDYMLIENELNYLKSKENNGRK